MLSDDRFQLPQHPFTDGADCISQLHNRSRCLKESHSLEIIRFEVFFRMKPTPGQKGVGNADGSGGLEVNTYGKFIVLYLWGIVKGTDVIKVTVLPVLVSKVLGNTG